MVSRLIVSAVILIALGIILEVILYRCKRLGKCAVSVLTVYYVICIVIILGSSLFLILSKQHSHEQSVETETEVETETSTEAGATWGTEPWDGKMVEVPVITYNDDDNDYITTIQNTPGIKYDPELIIPEDTLLDKTVLSLATSDMWDYLVVSNLIYQDAKASGRATDTYIIDTNEAYDGTSAFYYPLVAPYEGRVLSYYTSSGLYGVIEAYEGTDIEDAGDGTSVGVDGDDSNNGN